MGFGQEKVLWGPFSREPSWWMQNAMGFEGLWVKGVWVKRGSTVILCFNICDVFLHKV